MYFNFRRLIASCIHSWYIFAISLAVMLFLAAAYLYVRKPMTEVQAQLMLPPKVGIKTQSALSDLTSSFSLSDVLGSSYTINEIEVLKSHNVFLNTVKQLSLNSTCYQRLRPLRWMPEYEKAPFALNCAPSIPDTLGVSLRFDITPNDNGKFQVKVYAGSKDIFEQREISLPANLNTPYGTFTLSATEHFKPNKFNKYRILYSSYNAAAQGCAKSVNIFEPNKKADFIALTTLVTDPAYGKKLLSTIIDNYNRVGIIQIDDRNNRTLNFIDSRLDSLRGAMEVWEQRMNQFKIENQLTDIDLDAEFLIKQMEQVEKLNIAAQLENKILQQASDFISNPENANALLPNIFDGGSDKNEIGSISLNGSSISLYNQLMLEKLRLSTGAKEDNATIKRLDNQIKEAREAVIATLDNARENSKIKIEEINRLRAKTDKRIGSVPLLENEYINIYSQLRLQKELYLFMMKQREETNLSLASISPTLDILDEPYEVVPRPGMSTKMVLMLAFVVAFAFAFFWVYYIVMPGKPWMSGADLQKETKIPVLGTISNIDLLRSNIVFATHDLSHCKVLVATYSDAEMAADAAVLLTKSFEKQAKASDYEIIDAGALSSCTKTFDMALTASMTLIVVNPDQLTPKQLSHLNDLYAQGRLPRMALAFNS